MAPKRAATSPKRAAKAAKVVDPVEACLEEIGAGLRELSALTPPSARDMIQAMLPHWGSVVRADRHEFQLEYGRQLMGLFRGEEAVRQQGVDAVEAEIASLKAEEAKAAEKLEAARGVSAAASEAREAAQAAHGAAQAASADAKARLASAQKAKEDGLAEAEALASKKADVEQVMRDDWQALVAGTWQGKEWRRRAKAAKTAQELLRSWAAPESLVGGAGAAVALKPSDRGTFAMKAVESASGLFEKELQSISEKIAAAEDGKAKLEAGIADAEAAAKSAEEAESEALAAFLSAENAWAEAETAVGELRGADWGRKRKELDRKLGAAKASLSAIETLVRKVAEMEEREEAPGPVLGAEAAGAEATGAEAAALEEHPAPVASKGFAKARSAVWDMPEPIPEAAGAEAAAPEVGGAEA